MNSPVTPFALAGRILAILGMGFTAAVSILFFIGAFWWWAIGAAVGFLVFFGLIVVVEKYQSARGLLGPGPATEADNH